MIHDAVPGIGLRKDRSLVAWLAVAPLAPWACRPSSGAAVAGDAVTGSREQYSALTLHLKLLMGIVAGVESQARKTDSALTMMSGGRFLSC